MKMGDSMFLSDKWKEYELIDEYDGYQIVADIWNTSLNHDSEMIANADFYTIGRMREPRMVVKGSGKKKREEQDGWNGVIVSNELVQKLLYQNEIQSINKDKVRLQTIEDELVQAAETAMEEGTVENEALFEVLKKNDEGDAQPVFDAKVVKVELKLCQKQTAVYELLKQIDSLLNEKTALTKKIKEEEVQLTKDVEDRIEKLTDSEIDRLMYEKWFGTFVEDITELANKTLKKELDILKMLHNRYHQTLDAIDDEIAELMKEFTDMQQELVVM